MTPLGNRRLRPGFLVLAALTLGGLIVAAPPATRPAHANPAGSVHLPDLRTVIPDDGFGIADGPDGPELRYTHLVYNAGAGPLRIQPAYSEAAGTYLGEQELTTHDSSGNWSVVSTRRVADDFRYHAEHGHFHFPLASFGLYRVAADGGPGAAVTMSPKVGFCISDSYIYDASVPHAGVGHDLWGSCSDPTSLRGIAVGGADEYDYRDPGQAIPMTGVPDGTYWFRAESDPEDDFVESDESNNETDVLVTIANGEVTPGARQQPDTTPCRAALEGVRDGDRLTGTVPLSASTSAGAPDRVSYLLDGTVVGASSGPAPYAVDWDATGAVDGRHWLAARVRTTAGAVCTSPVLAVDVDTSSGPDTTGPQVRFTDPQAGGTVGGRVAVAVSAADASGVDRVQLLVDGQPLGDALTDPPYSLVWDSRAVSPGPHRLTARATDRLGNATVADLDVTVVASTPPKPIGLDSSVVARGRDRLTTPSFSTRYRRVVLLALVSYDGPSGADQQGATVTGAGLTWTLVKRSNTQAGDAEIWSAKATNQLTNATVTATPEKSGYSGSLTVIAYRNAAGVGIAGASGAPSGAPDIYLPGIGMGSWVFAVGHDWDRAVARTPVAGQVLQDQWLATSVGDTFWVQSTASPNAAPGLVTIHDNAPTNDRWNYAAVEVLPALIGPPPPPPPPAAPALSGTVPASPSNTTPPKVLGSA
jgi:hypothetical protein